MRTEVLDAVNGSWRGIKPTEQTVSLQGALSFGKCADKQRANQVPDADKFYSDIHREGFFELLTLLPSVFVVASVHPIREGNLLAIPRWKQADLG